MNTHFSVRSYQPMMAQRLRFGTQSATAPAPTNANLQLLLTIDPSSDQELENQLQKVAKDATITAEELLPVLKKLWEKTSGSSLRVDIMQALHKRKIAVPEEFLEKSPPGIVGTPGPKGVLL